MPAGKPITVHKNGIKASPSPYPCRPGRKHRWILEGADSPRCKVHEPKPGFIHGQCRNCRKHRDYPASLPGHEYLQITFHDPLPKRTNVGHTSGWMP